jgi:hypothetical protein
MTWVLVFHFFIGTPDEGVKQIGSGLATRGQCEQLKAMLMASRPPPEGSELECEVRYEI